jgi:hypothetical protein
MRRVAIDRFQAGAADEVLRKVKEGRVPLLAQLPGFLAYEVVKTGEDSAVFIHTCETKEQADVAVAGRRLLGERQRGQQRGQRGDARGRAGVHEPRLAAHGRPGEPPTLVPLSASADRQPAGGWSSMLPQAVSWVAFPRCAARTTI